MAGANDEKRRTLLVVRGMSAPLQSLRAFVPSCSLLICVCGICSLGTAQAAAPTPLRCLDGKEKVEVPPWGVVADASMGIGFFFATHGSVRFGIGRRLWDRLELEAAVQLSAGARLLGVNGGLRAGLLLHLSRRWELLLGWRVGVAGFQIQLPVDVLWTRSLLLSVIFEAKIFLTRSIELRVAPVVGTGYWNEIWGFVLEPTFGVAYRF